MYTPQQTPCNGATCASTGCTCGCPQPAAQTGCACGPRCPCGSECACGAAARCATR